MAWRADVGFMFFFFYCSADHRVLHSFPTRRSSDLCRVASWPRRADGGTKSCERADVVVHGGVVRDRKSTRLNSSHTVISYAVFCLKKKKTRHRAACP